MNLERTMRIIVKNVAAVKAAQQAQAVQPFLHMAEVRAARTDRRMRSLLALAKRLEQRTTASELRTDQKS